MLMRKDLLVPSAKITHLLMVYTSDMAVQIWPPKTSSIAAWVGAIVSQQQKRIHHNVGLFIFDSDVLICADNIRWRIILKTLHRIICEDNILRFCLELCIVSLSNLKEERRTRGDSPYNERNPSSCIELSFATHRYDMSGDCKAPQSCAPQVKHR